MRVSASLGLVLLLASLASCEQRNYARCQVDNADYKCEGTKYCQPIAGDPDHLGLCVDSQCTAMPKVDVPNGCTAAAPICTNKGLCTACTTSVDCAAISTTLAACVIDPTSTQVGTCAECAADADCVTTNPLTTKPACDKATHTCRACALHSECGSKVCVKDSTLTSLTPSLVPGMCAPPSSILIADSSTPLQTQIAAAGPAKPYILVKVVSVGITVGPIAGLPELHIIGPNADLSPSQLTAVPATANSLTVSAGGSVMLEGMILRDTPLAVSCNSGGNTTTSVRLLRSLIMTADLGIKTTPMCVLTVDSSWIGTPPNTSNPNGNFAAMTLDATKFEIVNTVFDHNPGKASGFGGITLTDSKTGLGLLQGRIVNSTFYDHTGVDMMIPSRVVYCQAAPKALAIFNTLFVNKSAPTGKPYVDPNCYTAPNVLGYYATDESPPPTGTTIITGIADSIFTNASNNVLSLQSSATPKSLITGGAKTLASAPSPLSGTAPLVDMEGTPRGATSVTIGAFEVPH